MQNLQPPTDNLYKFVALTGVVLAITALLWPTTIFYSLRLREFEYSAQMAAARADFEVWQGMEAHSDLQLEQNAENKLLLKQFMAEHPAESLPADVRELSKQEVLRVDQEKKDLIAAREKNFDRAAAADKALGALEAKRQEIDFLKWTARATLILAALLLLSGTALAVIGFRLWYYRVQVYQDKILVAEATAPKDAPNDGIRQWPQT